MIVAKRKQPLPTVKITFAGGIRETSYTLTIKDLSTIDKLIMVYCKSKINKVKNLVLALKRK